MNVNMNFKKDIKAYKINDFIDDNPVDIIWWNKVGFFRKHVLSGVFKAESFENFYILFFN
jgi:hypothetical protein